MNKLLYGVAYYYEYLPYDRLDEDIKMMKAAGINVVRIAESTWSTYEKQEGQFDFSTVTKVLDAMEEADIDVIIGTPTYAVPSWLVKMASDGSGCDPSGRRRIRSPSDHGHYESELSEIRGTCDPQAAGSMPGPQVPHWFPAG